jgi:hypothetical protein
MLGAAPGPVGVEPGPDYPPPTEAGRDRGLAALAAWAAERGTPIREQPT